MNMKKHLLFVVTALLTLHTLAQNTNSEWKAYPAYHDVTATLPVGDRVYTLASGGLFSYKFGETTVHAYSKLSGLAGSNITQMAYCDELKQLLLIYDDANIDILGINDSVINIPQYKNSSFSDKTINGITIMGHEAFLATNFGIIVINLKRAEFTNVYELGTSVRSAIGNNDCILARVNDGVIRGDRSKNLLDRNNWQSLTTSKPRSFVSFNGGIYALYGDALYTFDTETAKITSLCKGSYTICSPYGNDLLLASKTTISLVSPEEEVTTRSITNDFASLSYDGTHFWAARNYNGLCSYQLDADTLKPVGQPVIPNSPLRNYFSEISYTPSGKLLVAGGALAYSGKTYYEGTAMTFENGVWTNFSSDSIRLKTGLDFINATSIAQDPNDPTHHFVSSADGGLFEFRNARFQNLYNSANSPLSSILPNSALELRSNRVCGVKYDPQGNLWMFNNQVDTIVRVLTPSKEWKSFFFQQIKGYPTFDNYIFDQKGRVWMTHRRWAGNYYAGIACFDHNGTLLNTADDKFAFCSTFTNQNGTTATIGLLYNAVFDHNGQLWIATNQGVFVLENPDRIFSANITFRQPVVPRNDGTNYADYLLDGVAVKTIVVDGANRKWIGTTDNGLYLVSPDGQEIITHYTAQNSPLISNCILSLAIHPDNGTIMIGTDQGLVSLRGDATTPATSLDEDNIKVFPNPVRPEYTGKIRVTGFTADSDVKITTNTGQVIAQGTSLGGTFVWDGRDNQGKRVATGIYYVVGSDADGKNGVIAKILMVK